MTSSRVMVLRIGLVVAAVAAALAFGWFRIVAPYEEATQADLGRGDYRLSATDGTDFTEASLSGAPTALFFGFTHCPEVCPTTMGDIATWKETLGARADDLKVYFVTVDPERDTAEVLGDYVGWVEGVVGVTGSRAEIDKAIRSFRVYAARVPLKDGGYTMDHSAYVMLFDRQGRFAEPIRYQEEFGSAVAKLERLLDR